MAKAVERDGRGSGVVARRDHLYRGDVQECGEEDLRRGRFAPGPLGLFNSSLECNTRRAIDFHAGIRLTKRRGRRSFALPWR